MEIGIGAFILVALLFFFFYAAIAVGHAARFRYLSMRSVYLSLLFTFSSIILVGIVLFSYVAYLNS